MSVKKQVQSMSKRETANYTVTELRKLAAQRDIVGRSRMRKRELCNALGLECPADKQRPAKSLPQVPEAPPVSKHGWTAQPLEIQRLILLHKMPFGSRCIPAEIRAMCSTEKRALKLCDETFWKEVVHRMMYVQKNNKVKPLKIRFGDMGFLVGKQNETSYFTPNELDALKAKLPAQFTWQQLAFLIHHQYIVDIIMKQNAVNRGKKYRYDIQTYYVLKRGATQFVPLHTVDLIENRDSHTDSSIQTTITTDDQPGYIFVTHYPQTGVQTFKRDGKRISRFENLVRTYARGTLPCH